MLETWDQQRAAHVGARDDYLDALADVREAGFLDEYVVYYFGAGDWNVPAEVNVKQFNRWQKKHLPNHKASTRIIGSWNYERNVMQ